MARVIYTDRNGQAHPAETFEASEELIGNNKHRLSPGSAHISFSLPDGRRATRLNVLEGTGPRTYSRVSAARAASSPPAEEPDKEAPHGHR